MYHNFFRLTEHCRICEHYHLWLQGLTTFYRHLLRTLCFVVVGASRCFENWYQFVRVFPNLFCIKTKQSAWACYTMREYQTQKTRQQGRGKTQAIKNPPCGGFLICGVPTGIRTPVVAVKGQCPRPLDDGDSKPKIFHIGGANRDRTDDLLHAMQALSQLSYSPTCCES